MELIYPRGQELLKNISRDSYSSGWRQRHRNVHIPLCSDDVRQGKKSAPKSIVWSTNEWTWNGGQWTNEWRRALLRIRGQCHLLSRSNGRSSSSSASSSRTWRRAGCRPGRRVPSKMALPPARAAEWAARRTEPVALQSMVCVIRSLIDWIGQRHQHTPGVVSLSVRFN